MTANIIVQVFLSFIFVGGIVGVFKFQGLQKIIGAFVALLALIASILTWSIK